MKANTRWLSAVSCVALGVSMLSGCATVKEGLVGQEYENVVPFAEQTISSLSVQRIDFRDSEFAYLRAISQENTPEAQHLRELLSLVEDFRDQIIYYSVELVRIAELSADEEERVSEYAQTFAAMHGQFVSQLDMDESEISAIEQDIRSQESLLEAIRTAQPVIDRAGNKFEILVREIEEHALVETVTYFDNLIETHYAEFMRYNDILVARRDEMLLGLSLLRDHRMGDPAALDRLRELSIISLRKVDIPASPSESQLNTIENFLLTQMRQDDEIAEYLQTDVEAYLAAHAELNREEAEVLNGLNVARLQIIAWTRAHKAMADGNKEPGKWLKVAMDAAAAVRRVK